MYCDVASGFNFQIGHFLHLYRVERKKSHSPLHNMIQNTMKKVWLACVQRYLLNLPYKRMFASSVSVENKAIRRSSKQKELRLR